MKRVTRNELIELAIFCIAYSMIESEITEEQIPYIDKDSRELLEKIRDNMLKVTRTYSPEQVRIMSIIDNINHIVEPNKTSFCVTTPQLGLAILSLSLPENERKNTAKLPQDRKVVHIIPKILEQFWVDNEEDIRQVLYCANDGVYEDTSEASEKVAMIYIDAARGMKK